MAKDFDGLLDYDFHPPEDLRLFTIPRSGVLRSDDEVVIYEVGYGEIVLRHYAFRDHWFKVNCTFDGSGTLIEDDDTQNGPAFALNCDIATPMVRDGNAVFSTDLCIDVLIRADGIDHQVVDMAEFEVALRRGWISDREALGARNGLRALQDLIERRKLLGFLAGYHPFQPSVVPQALATRHMSPGGIPFVVPGKRPSW